LCQVSSEDDAPASEDADEGTEEGKDHEESALEESPLSVPRLSQNAM
jgi:hypothetical protein